MTAQDDAKEALVSLYRQGKEAANYLIRELNFAENIDSAEGAGKGAHLAHGEILDALDRLAQAALQSAAQPALPVDLEGLDVIIAQYEHESEDPAREVYRNGAFKKLLEAARRYAQSPARVNRELLDALKAVKREQIESDGNHLYNITMGGLEPVTVKLSYETRKLCEDAIASVEQLEGNSK